MGCVIKCRNNGRNSSCKFYSFPTSRWKLEQINKWKAAAKRKNANINTPPTHYTRESTSSDLMRLYASPLANSASQPNSSVTSQQKSVTSHKKPSKKASKVPETPQHNASALSGARAASQNSGATENTQLAPTAEESLASDHATWSAITESPLILVEGESKKLKLQFDVSQFDPAEVKVQILNDVLHVKAKHDERTDNSLVLREYSRQFVLPKGVDPEAVVSSLSRDGVLTVEAPLPQLVLELGKELEKIKADKK